MKWLLLAGELGLIWFALSILTALLWGLLRRSRFIDIQDRR